MGVFELEEGDDGRPFFRLEDLPDHITFSEELFVKPQPELVPVTIFADANTVVGLGRVVISPESVSVEIHIPNDQTTQPIQARIAQGYALGFGFTETPAQEIDTSNKEQ